MKDRRSILRLIEWDKCWLHFKEIIDYIMIKQFDEDYDFFDELSLAVKRRGYYLQKVKDKKFYLELKNQLIQFFVETVYCDLPYDEKVYKKALCEEAIYDEKENPLVNDSNYLKKYFKRHNL